MDNITFKKIQHSIQHALNSEFYKKHFEGIQIAQITSIEDFYRLPFTDKADLRKAYPFGLLAVPPEMVVRVHSSSGTTGDPIIIPYTRKDIDDWINMFVRCYMVAGIGLSDIIQITPGYGLWTAGIGFQQAAEKLGAMVIPMGPGNTEKQIRMMIDFRSTVLTATSSYALLLAEEIEKKCVKNQINLKKGIFGSEQWGEKTRTSILDKLGIELYDIYGLTEIYGPGIGISCKNKKGIHLWTDYIFYEIIDPQTGRNVPKGTYGELVITTLCKEGAPLIRYRTHDITRELPMPCPCGLPYPLIDNVVGRSDDMVKVKGTIVYPRLIEEILSTFCEIGSEYQVQINRKGNRDILQLIFETTQDNQNRYLLEEQIKMKMKSSIGITPIVCGVSVGYL